MEWQIDLICMMSSLTLMNVSASPIAKVCWMLASIMWTFKVLVNVISMIKEGSK